MSAIRSDRRPSPAKVAAQRANALRYLHAIAVRTGEPCNGYTAEELDRLALEAEAAAARVALITTR